MSPPKERAPENSRERIAMYVLDRQRASRQELSEALHLSMPTVFQHVTELMKRNVLREEGTFGSTGGRRAKVLTMCRETCCAVGAEITPHQVRMVLLDLGRQLLDAEDFPLDYEDGPAYCRRLGELVCSFAGPAHSNRLAGVGIALPGIIDPERDLLVRSHALGVSNVSLLQLRQSVPCPVLFGNDADLAAYAEVRDKGRDTLYLSLNDTVGGALYLGGGVFPGDNWKSGEFGHMVLIPGGKRCYCGKEGCLDAYCSAKVLREGYATLEEFFAALSRGEPACRARWETYSDCLAVAISNLRMALDCDMVLGGDVGGHMDGVLPAFTKKLARYDDFDPDMTFLRTGAMRQRSAAIGAGWRMLDRCIRQLCREDEALAIPPDF